MTLISSTDIPVAHNLYSIKDHNSLDIYEQVAIISRAYGSTLQDYNRDISHEGSSTVVVREKQGAKRYFTGPLGEFVARIHFKHFRTEKNVSGLRPKRLLED